jgi:hypothetical protein
MDRADLDAADRTFPSNEVSPTPPAASTAPTTATQLTDPTVTA